MGSIQSRTRPLESVISICVLAVLSLICVGIFVKQSDVDMSRFGIDVTTTQLSSQKPEISKTALSSFLPAGFETLSETKLYNSENLYEKINGKAPLYTESGFEKLLTCRFVNTNNDALWMELYVYDMAAIKNAFSVYSMQKRAEVRILPEFAFGYKTSNAVFFVHGKYYIEMVGSAESGELFEAMLKTAHEIIKNLTVDEDTDITELSLFARENIVPDSAKLYLTEAFGFEGLANTFTAEYEIDGQAVTAFLSKRTSKDAEAAATAYRNFLIENGAVAKKAIDKTLEGKVLGFYDTTEIVFATGPFVAGIHEAQNQQAAEKLAVTLINKLSEASKTQSDD